MVSISFPWIATKFFAITVYSIGNLIPMFLSPKLLFTELKKGVLLTKGPLSDGCEKSGFLPSASKKMLHAAIRRKPAISESSKFGTSWKVAHINTLTNLQVINNSCK